MVIKQLQKNLFFSETVFPNSICKKILRKFEKNFHWDFISQKKGGHYGHVFKSKSPFLPEKKETYLAQFYRSDNLKKDNLIINAVKKYILPSIEKRFLFKIKNCDIRCHKFIKKNFLRIHFDNYTAKLALTINLNKKWKWDWGGTLCVAYGKKFQNIYTICPNWNTMSILSSLKNTKEAPHYVTPVLDYAQTPRYSITIFIS
jgi:Rps23 Pro-64 3,4-dihydroxylase Tpa1-like proline 4-hydroxylase